MDRLEHPEIPARDPRLAGADDSVRAVGRALVLALVLHELIHYVGLLASVAGLGASARWIREQAATGAPPRFDNFGEMQPLGRLEEAIPLIVGALLVLFLGAVVRRARLERRARASRPIPRAERALAALAALTWVAAMVTVTIGDSRAERARTIFDAHASDKLETAAEAGFLAAGALLISLTLAILRRSRHPTRATPRHLAWIAAAVAVLAAVPVPAVYDRTSHGPGTAELRLRVAVERAWNRHERAAASLDPRAIRTTTTGPALPLDLMVARFQREGGRRVRSARPLSGVRPLGLRPGALRMLASVDTTGGPLWDGRFGNPAAGRTSELLMLERATPSSPWRVAFEVPFLRWPGPWDGFALDPRGRPDPIIRRAFEATGRGRRNFRVAYFPLRGGGTIGCMSSGSPATRADLGCMLVDRAGGTTIIGAAGVKRSHGDRGHRPLPARWRPSRA